MAIASPPSAPTLVTQGRGADLVSYIRSVRRWAWMLVLSPVVAAVAAGGASLLLHPIYESQVQVLVKPAQPLTTTDAGVVSLSADQVSRTYAQLMTEEPLLEQVIKELNLNVSPVALAKQVKVAPTTGTTILTVSVDTTDPKLAALIANTLVDDFIADTNKIQQQQIDQYTSRLQTQIQQIETRISSEQAQLDSLNRSQTPLTADQQATKTNREQSLAADQAEYAQLIKDQADIESQTLRSSDSLLVVAPAGVPGRPISPNIPLNIGIAFAAGLLVALGLAWLLEYLDQSIKSDEELQSRTGLVPIGHVPYWIPEKRRLGEIVSLMKDSPSAEAYKTLRTNLLFSSIDQDIKTIVVTSGSPGEGKTRTAANLAVALAQAGHRTLLVDADFRRPSQHRIFSKVRNVGLSNMILQDQPEAELLTPIPEVQNLWLLTSGPTPPNPSELLGSARMRALLTQMRKNFTYVIVDTPPVNAVTDPMVLSAYADGTVVVIEQGSTTYPALLQARRSLDRVNAHILGAVVNKLRATEGGYYYYDYYRYNYYGKSRPEPKEVKAPATTDAV